jgi:hypothetical protein
MGKIKTITVIGHKTMNGREVPIYRINTYSQEEVKLANEIAAREITKELGEPSSPKEILTILKDHAEATTGEKVEPKITIEVDKKE